MNLVNNFQSRTNPTLQIRQVGPMGFLVRLILKIINAPNFHSTVFFSNLDTTLATPQHDHTLI